MKTYFLDTSVIIDYLRGQDTVVRFVHQLEGKLTSSFICLAELFEGVHSRKNASAARRVVLNFFAGLTTTYGLNGEIAELFGRLRRDLKMQGQVIEDIDIFIAATCMADNLVLLTLNVKHFIVIPGLKILSPHKTASERFP